MSQNIGKPINTQMNEGAATISADGKTIIFTACEQNGVYSYGRNGYGSCDLFFTRRKGNRWSNPVNLGPPINTSNWESQPSLSADGETLYFVRGVRRALRRESDIYVSTLDKEGYWTNPKKLPPTINTEEAEESVFIHPNGKNLYFASRGHVGMGGSDIFMSTLDENQEWGPAINLGYPINTYKDENSLLVGPDGEIGYFASDREGGFGGLDIYGFPMPEEIKPEPVTYFKGLVYDSLSKQLLGAQIELIDMASSKVIKNGHSNGSTGEFFLTLSPHRDYIINVSKDGYLFYSDAFLSQKNFDRLKPFIKNIPLLPIEVGSSIVLKNIFFETDKSNLKQESFIELKKLQKFLQHNPKISIEIAGHTDNIGSYDYNKELSGNRAKAVYEYLVGEGISAERLSYKGYSYDKPIAPNDTEEGRAQNRRTEFIIIRK
jgi:outer membrane protein OmpA-like peptidoglycan-associated protein